MRENSRSDLRRGPGRTDDGDPIGPPGRGVPVVERRERRQHGCPARAGIMSRTVEILEPVRSQ